MYRLQEDQYRNVYGLFSRPYLRLMMEAVLAGNCPIRIWADDAAAPQMAFAWGLDGCCYLAGDAHCAVFNRALKRVFAEEVAPEAVRRGLEIFKLYTSHIGWHSHLSGIFETLTHRDLGRCFFALNALKQADWRMRIPEGFSVARIDPGFFEDRLKYADRLQGEIEWCWPSVGAFFDRGFGFVVKTEEEICCWCTAEYMSGELCGLGIETVEAYQKRGFATLAASACAEHALFQNLTPHWDSWTKNAPSIAVAKKVGFEKVLDYTVSLGRFEG